MTDFQPLKHQSLPIERPLERELLRIRRKSIKIASIAGQSDPLGDTHILKETGIGAHTRLTYMKLLGKVVERSLLLIQNKSAHQAACDAGHPLFLQVPPHQLYEILGLLHAPPSRRGNLRITQRTYRNTIVQSILYDHYDMNSGPAPVLRPAIQRVQASKRFTRIEIDVLAYRKHLDRFPHWTL